MDRGGGMERKLETAAKETTANEVGEKKLTLTALLSSYYKTKNTQYQTRLFHGRPTSSLLRISSYIF